MKTWRIPVEWAEFAVIYVAANTLEEAIEKARNDDIPLPDDRSYIDGSWMVSDDQEYIRQCFNDNQKDEEVKSHE